jgi:acyl-CoA reductase-like NAD-dependent aldehyde dehydrogenase
VRVREPDIHSRGLYDKFAAPFTEKVKGFNVGYGFDKETTHGPVIHARVFDKVEKHVKDARSKGAKIPAARRSRIWETTSLPRSS